MIRTLSLATCTVALLAASCTTPFHPPRQDDAPPKQSTHDVRQGIDSDGRIPKVALPADLPNPKRWRYIPEGRIKPGNLIDRFLITSFIVPILFFESDVGFGGGVSITDLDFRNQRRQEFAGIFTSYTTEGQQRYSLLWQRWLHHRELEGGGVLQEERSIIRARAGYERSLTRRFFGFGPDTREGNETSYTDESVGLGFRLQRTIPDPGDDLVFDIGATVQHRNLSRGRVSDVPSTEQVFPGVVASGDSHDSLVVNTSIRYDTRDSQHNPYSGFAIGAGATAFPLQTGGDSGIIVRAFSTAIWQLPPLFHDGGDEAEENPPTDTIAASALVVDASGDLPFWALPSLGGSNTLRGYIANRWTDESAWHAALEYRFWLVPRGFPLSKRVRVERLGLALFAEAGSVAPSFRDLGDADVKSSYGMSLRLSLERQALFRSDFGFSDEGFNLTIRYGLSF